MTNEPVCESGAPSKWVQVLIVEDSAIVRERLVDLVVSLPNVLTAVPAQDGWQAEALFSQFPFDAIVLDIQLPGRNGMELLARFKKARPSSVVMMLTTYAFKELRQNCATLGADYFFDKSREFERVTDVIKALHR